MINCPKCESEALVETPALGNIPLDMCLGCGGIWFDKDELEALLKQSEGWHEADFNLINPKSEGLECPRCKSKMSRGGLVNPLLLVDKCPSCGGIWLDARELDLVKKQLGLTGGATEVTGLTRPAPVPVAEPVAPRIKILPMVCAALGFIGVSCEIIFYFTPADKLLFGLAVSWSLPATVVSVLLFAYGLIAMDWTGKKR